MRIDVETIKMNTIKTINKLEENIFLKLMMLFGIGLVVFVLPFTIFLWIVAVIPERIQNFLELGIYGLLLIQIAIEIFYGIKRK